MTTNLVLLYLCPHTTVYLLFSFLFLFLFPLRRSGREAVLAQDAESRETDARADENADNQLQDQESVWRCHELVLHERYISLRPHTLVAEGLIH